MMQTASVPLEIKSVSGREFTGYGSVFGNVDYGGDVVLPGAFRRSLKEHAAAGTLPAMFWMHKADEVPGVWLEMREDKAGLAVRGEVLDTSLGRDVRTLLEKKAVRGLSIGYRPVETDWRDDGVRLLKEVELFEVSIVSLAMNPLARVEALKARLSADGEYVPSERDLETYFRRLGCSRTVARTLMAKLFDDEGDASGMLGGHSSGMLGNVGDEKAVLASLAELTDKVFAASLQRNR